ncbi:MAG: hypothetical protein RL618_1730, partial [Pseudomonadota bacterium]
MTALLGVAAIADSGISRTDADNNSPPIHDLRLLQIIKTFDILRENSLFRIPCSK